MGMGLALIHGSGLMPAGEGEAWGRGRRNSGLLFWGCLEVGRGNERLNLPGSHLPSVSQVFSSLHKHINRLRHNTPIWTLRFRFLYLFFYLLFILTFSPRSTCFAFQQGLLVEIQASKHPTFKHPEMWNHFLGRKEAVAAVSNLYSIKFTIIFPFWGFLCCHCFQISTPSPLSSQVLEHVQS